MGGPEGPSIPPGLVAKPGQAAVSAALSFRLVHVRGTARARVAVPLQPGRRERSSAKRDREGPVVTFMAEEVKALGRLATGSTTSVPPRG